MLAPERFENLALIYQEVLTATTRLRSNRQAVSDAESFRANTREALRLADTEGRRRGYSEDELQLARFAAVAFLDESILNSRLPVFSDWSRKPLQEELFGVHVAGEIFFRNLEKLLKQNDSAGLADVLEVYYLCLLLGFAGRYSISAGGELRSIRDAVGEKIRRIRGDSPEFSPSWSPGEQAGPMARSDPWVRRLMITAVACFGLMVVLLLFFVVMDNHWVNEIRIEAARGAGAQ
jgi:type VI secretion system protein ImpK